MTAPLPRTTVWRVENERDGHGPYQDWDERLYRMGYDHSDTAHPGPYADKGIRRSVIARAYAAGREPLGEIWEIDSLLRDPAYVFGFRNHDDAFEWFDGWLDVLADRGFVLRCYQPFADRTITGTRQVLFDRRRARLVSTEHLTDDAATEATA